MENQRKPPDRHMESIIAFLTKNRGFDFAGYRPSMIKRRVEQRVTTTGCGDMAGYLVYLGKHPNELDRLVNALTIHVSRFFRNPLMFEYVAQRVIPGLLKEKRQNGEHDVRIWSAGCAFGEEPYSIAILMREVLEKEASPMRVHIFASDIVQGALEKAKSGRYRFESVKDVKYGLLRKYFVHRKDRGSKVDDVQGESFELTKEILNAVNFNVYDILNPATFAPPESIFGGFDMIFCRNLLIYFDTDYRNRIMEKFSRALEPGGYLVLGESESPTYEYQRCFKTVNACCHVYQKM